jgi:four helix bundle protein
MATFKRFEDIEAWKIARRLTSGIYEVTKAGAFSRDFPLRDQVRRAGISTMSNVAEGFERDGRKEFIQFLSVAKGSSGEVKSHLYVALDQGYIVQEAFDRLYGLASESGRTIGGLMNYLRDVAIRGTKYKQPETRNSKLETL